MIKPLLPPGGLTRELLFSLTKDESKRPKYKELLVSYFQSVHFILGASAHVLFVCAHQRDPFIQMYEERSVDVACYVCRIQDQMPASPSSPTYMD